MQKLEICASRPVRWCPGWFFQPAINGEDEDDNDDNDEDDDGNITWVFNVHDLDQLAQAKLDSMLKKIANPNIKSILKCFDINDYRKRGEEKRKTEYIEQ